MKTCLAASTSASSRRRIGASSARRPKADSASICGSGSTSCASTVPPLRERPGTCRCSPSISGAPRPIASARARCSAPDALAALARYDWPGNVRELQNAIAWMAVHAPSPRPHRLIVAARTPGERPLATGSSFEAAREDFERRFVRAALAQAGGQRHVAAKALGVTRQGLSKMLRRLRIRAGDVDMSRSVSQQESPWTCGHPKTRKFPWIECG